MNHFKKRKLIIAVDGPAGSGKSSVSKEVAKVLGIKYIDSGALYRAMTLFLLSEFGKIEKNVEYDESIADVELQQTFNHDGSLSTYLNGKDVSKDIRTEMITQNIGIVSDDPKIRCFINNYLRSWAPERTIIMDGRDIGTIVFPEADIKIYLDARVDVRSKRRSLEYEESGKTVDVNQIKKQIIRRDQEDTTRPYGRLIRAPDAIYIDTSEMSKREVIDRILEIIKALIKE